MRVSGAYQGWGTLEVLALGTLEVLAVTGCVEHLRSLKILDVRNCPKLRWGEGVLEQLQRQLRGYESDAFLQTFPSHYGGVSDRPLYAMGILLSGLL